MEQENPVSGAQLQMPSTPCAARKRLFLRCADSAGPAEQHR
jgi:hypothetical protein